MTTIRNKTNPLVCDCGHEGTVFFSENDEPFTKQWEEYRLGGFKGETLNTYLFKGTPEELISILQPTCPQCGQTGNVRYKSPVRN